MCETKIVSDGHGHVLGTHDWVEGFKPFGRTTIVVRTEDEAQAYALWLENHVSSEAGLEFLEVFFRCGAVVVSEPGAGGVGAR